MRYNAYQKLNCYLFITIIKTTKFHTIVTVQKNVKKKKYVFKTNITISNTSNMNVKIKKNI